MMFHFPKVGYVSSLEGTEAKAAVALVAATEAALLEEGIASTSGDGDGQEHTHRIHGTSTIYLHEYHNKSTKCR